MTSSDSDNAISFLNSRVSALEAETKTNRELLVRIDERTKAFSDDIKILREGFVRRDEYLPVRNLVYGLVGIILVGFITAVVRFFTIQAP